MKKLLLLFMFVLLFLIAEKAIRAGQIDYQCFNQCLQRGYTLGFCQSRCSY